MPIHFFYLDVKVTLTQRTLLKQFVTSIFTKHKLKVDSINYIFCTDAHLLSINQAHLKHNFYTDIITFDLSETNGSVVADIYISVDRVRDNAVSIGTTLKEELHRVIFHGALHLCGFKDKSSSDVVAMRTEEESCLRRYLGY
jgi:probable rRNA maturation factor